MDVVTDASEQDATDATEARGAGGSSSTRMIREEMDGALELLADRVGRVLAVLAPPGVRFLDLAGGAAREEDGHWRRRASSSSAGTR